MRVGEVAVPSRRQKQQRWLFRVTWGTAIVASLCLWELRSGLLLFQSQSVDETRPTSSSAKEAAPAGLSRHPNRNTTSTGDAMTTNSTSTGTSTSTEKQPHRTTQKQNQKLILIHLGKTAGSSITCMLHPSVYASGTGNSGCNATTDYHPRGNAIAHSVVARIHLAAAPVLVRNDHDTDNTKTDNNTNFLVTVRNPVDRILSWYYFLHPAYPPVKKPHHRQGCPDYAKFFRCWNSIQALSDEGLLLRAKDTKTERREENAVDHTSSTTVKAAARCDTRLAWDMVVGKQQCWHNYFNYNVTYGPLLQQAARRDDDGQKQIIIYTLRTEHLEEDWNEINVLLGGSANNFHRVYKNDWKRRIQNNTRDDLNKQPNQQQHPQQQQQQHFDQVSDPDTTRTLSELGRSNLCRALCEEIQIYKKMLRLAVNLHDQHRNASLDELLRTCPRETREVRTCPSYY